MIVVALANNAAALPQDATLPAIILILFKELLVFLKRLRNLTADRSDTGSSLTFWDFTFCSKRAVHCMARNMLMFLVIKLDATASRTQKPQEWMTDDRLPLCNVHSINIGTNDHFKSWHNRLNKKAGGIKLGLYKLIYFPKEKQGAMQTVIGQLLSRNPVAGSIRQISNRYTEKQRQVIQKN
ncbi:hypothetical protein T01_6400 [Trichinella spiralis]|uniref:Uncharacterized protein n=1 Tax=Trichinella spiralis TaxID=6334 RepID=A0A0V1AQW0_TRISP|nr:hypothetical protein T01_6400 [Trichinella spiralis]